MADLLQSATQWVNSVRKSQLSQLVTLTRGALSAASVPASPVGQTDFTVDPDTGVIVEEKRLPWIVSKTDYDFGAGAVEPQRGDKLKHTIGSTTYVWEAVGLGSGPVASDTDPYGEMWTIQYVAVGTE